MDLRANFVIKPKIRQWRLEKNGLKSFREFLNYNILRIPTVDFRTIISDPTRVASSILLYPNRSFITTSVNVNAKDCISGHFQQNIE